MSVANDIFDKLVEGPEGDITLTAAIIDEIDRDQKDPAAIEAKLDHALKTRPGLKIVITDAPYGGLRIRWRTK